MSSSEILFRGKARNLKDSVIGRFLDELSVLLQETDLDWLKVACEGWQEDWKTMPPGCKDIDLDEVITSEKFRLAFDKKIREVQDIVTEESIKNELERVLELIM